MAACKFGFRGIPTWPSRPISIFEQFFHQPLDLDLAKACDRVYNDWMIEYCSEAPDRFWGQAFIGLWDIDYANDYPHPGGIWPYTDDTIELTLSTLPAETRRKVLAETLAKVYGQPMPAPIARQPSSDYTDAIRSRPWLKKAGEFTFDKPQMGLAV